MKIVLSLALVGLAVVGTGAATAAPFATFPTPGATSVPSSLGITLSAFSGLLVIPIAPAAITGTADAEVSLNIPNDGTAEILSSDFALADIVGSANTILGNVNYSLLNVGFEIVFGPSTVAGGNFAINATTPGSLVLNQGTVDVTGSFATSIDLAVDSITLSFADLGANTLLGFADDSLSGADTTAPGDEIFIDWNGASTIVDLSGNAATITLTGAGLSLGALVPEPTSGLFLASMISASAVVRRRRK